ncbi:uncharacterized protein LACBIDRAFT_298727 [Laccaria bicolor S238N-H82]|uniref:Predicted protein n=1 Tax=Laccaria bicolor (strain S238N-H82 / ATCC MYA-4686) TaxID=486041 RepID=B0DDH6_LACBS|nr:uncharacterized protein LACBIDRAFT_298727 [Laccaria bicolor S238N-H82]EDR07612.1 predicted protein [Laccaria bicolor S238N-H82]|eukprot:XP_001882004.1 predicted protein [Laccaria bicolor S238N-H82]
MYRLPQNAPTPPFSFMNPPSTPWRRNDVSPSAKRCLCVLANFSSRSTTSCNPPSVKTTYRRPQKRQTSPSGFQNPSTSPWRRDDISSSAKRPLRAAIFFQPLHNALHPSWPQDDVSSSANRSHASLQLQKPFHLSMGLPGRETTYRRPLNAFYVLENNPNRSTMPLARRRRIVFRQTAPHHPRASRTLPPRHRSPRCRDDVSTSAKRPPYMLDFFSSRSPTLSIPPDPKTTYRRPQDC